MKIAVLVKQVPDTETKIQVTDGKINEAGIKWAMNPYDEFAVEEALKLKEKLGQAEVIIFSAGPQRVVEAIRQALAMGADRGVRIDATGVELDPFTTASVLAKAVAEEQCQIVFAGKQAIDDDAQQVHIAVAELLKFAHAVPVSKFEFVDASKVKVHCPAAGGRKEVLEVSLPAVLGCDKGLNQPRYASLPGIMKAKTKPLKELKAADLLGETKALTQNTNYTLPPEGRRNKIIPGSASEAAQELVRLLREEAKVL